MTDLRQWLAQVTPLMKLAQPLPDAAVHYDLFADALRWSDEIPPGSPENGDVWGCLRGLWRYRTGLILGDPPERFRDLWHAASELFPDWPGFAPERRDLSWKPLYLALSREAVQEWEAAAKEKTALHPVPK